MKALIVIARNHEPRAGLMQAIIDADLVIRLDPSLQEAWVIKDTDGHTPHRAEVWHFQGSVPA